MKLPSVVFLTDDATERRWPEPTQMIATGSVCKGGHDRQVPAWEQKVLTDTSPKPELRDYLAAERTLLAWIRTGLALMGFGFVVARFGLFLQQLQLIEHTPSAPSYGQSLWFGTALIVLGVVVNCLSAWHHLRLVRELQSGEPVPIRPSMQAVSIALFLALLGLAMATYLVSVHSVANSHL
jgi:putative membrane protein